MRVQDGTNTPSGRIRAENCRHLALSHAKTLVKGILLRVPLSPSGGGGAGSNPAGGTFGLLSNLGCRSNVL
jgi:hypothetical protein